MLYLMQLPETPDESVSKVVSAVHLVISAFKLAVTAGFLHSIVISSVFKADAASIGRFC